MDLHLHIGAPYPMNHIEMEDVERQIVKLLKERSIRPKSSLFGAAILQVCKKDGSFRMCIDNGPLIS